MHLFSGGDTYLFDSPTADATLTALGFMGIAGGIGFAYGQTLSSFCVGVIIGAVSCIVAALIRTVADLS